MISKPALRSALIGEADEHFSSAYFFQYVSLMFILLTFTIGSFRMQDADAAFVPEAPTEVVSPDEASGPRRIGEMEIGGMFDPAGAVGGAAADALADFLSTHDVDAAIDLVSGESEGSFARSASRAIALAHFLVARGVPAAAFSITVRPQGNGVQSSVRFFSSPR